MAQSLFETLTLARLYARPLLAAAGHTLLQRRRIPLPAIADKPKDPEPPPL